MPRIPSAPTERSHTGYALVLGLGGYVRVTASRPIFSFQLFGSRTSMDFLANVPAQGTLLAPQGSGRTVVADTGANVIATDGSASIVVPPGALTVDTEIDLTAVELVTLPDPSAYERVVAAVEAQPSGTHFDIPVKLTFSLAVQLDPNTELPLSIFDPETRTYELSEFVAIVDESGRAASADVTHFTTFTAGQPTAQLLGVSAVVPASGIAGSSVTVEGAGFAPSVDGNTVTFAGADNASVVAEVTGVSTNSLSVIVPEGVVTGNVIVQAGDRSSVGVLFTVPRLDRQRYRQRTPFYSGLLVAGSHGNPGRRTGRARNLDGFATASDGTSPATDELTITVNPANQSPTANAGTDQTLTSPAVANLAGTATDDADDDVEHGERAGDGHVCGRECGGDDSGVFGGRDLCAAVDGDR